MMLPARLKRPVRRRCTRKAFKVNLWISHATRPARKLLYENEGRKQNVRAEVLEANEGEGRGLQGKRNFAQRRLNTLVDEGYVEEIDCE